MVGSGGEIVDVFGVSVGAGGGAAVGASVGFAVGVLSVGAVVLASSQETTAIT